MGLAIYTDFPTGPTRMRMLREVFEPLDACGVEAVRVSARRVNGCVALTANTDTQCVTGYGYSMTRACEDACARIVVSRFVGPSV